jgi:hypothetical protein
VKYTLDVKNINKIFSTSVRRWRSTKTNKTYIGALHYTPPPTLQDEFTSYEEPCDNSGQNTNGADGVLDEPYRGDKKRALNQQGYSGVTNTSVIRDTYHLPEDLDYDGESATQCVFATIDQSFAPVDLKSWQKASGLTQIPVWNITGPNDPDVCAHSRNNCGEGNLDIQYINSIAPNAHTWFWSVPYNPFYSPFIRFIEELNADPNPPDVHSISYANSENMVDPRLMKYFNGELCKLALRGITIIVSSGDYGAPGLEGCGLSSKDQICTLNP